MPEPAHVVVALGSGGTAAGLLVGLRAAGLSARLHAIQVNDLTPLGPRSLARLAMRAQRTLRRAGAGHPQVLVRPQDITVHDDWLGAGYGHETPEATAATSHFAELGVELDPVYTAKAAAATLALQAAGRLPGGPTLLWNTHAPALR